MTQHFKSLIQMAFQNSALNSASIFSSSITKKNHNSNSLEKLAIGKSTKMSDKLMNSNEKLKVTPRVNSTKERSEYSCASNGSSSSSSSKIKIETKLKIASIDQPANIPMLVVRSHHPSAATTTNGENTINCQLRVRKGTAVNALFMINNWIYVKTFEENEGFIPKKCCEAFGGSKKSSGSSKRQLVFNSADEASICSSEISSKPNVNHTYISIVDDPNLDNIYNEKRNHAQIQDNDNNDLNCSFECKDNTNLSLFSISRCYVNEPCITENKQAATVLTPIDKKASKISRANEMDSLRKSKSRNRKLSIALKQIPSAMTLTMIEQEIDMTMTMKKRAKVNSKQQERNYNNIDNESDKNLNLPNIIQNLNQNQDKKKKEKMCNSDEFIYYTNETVSQKRHHMSSEAKSKYMLARKRIKLYAALKQERVYSAAKRAKYAHKSASSSSSLSSCSIDETKKVASDDNNDDAAYDFLMTCSSDLRFSPVQKPKQQQQQQKKPVDLYQVICDYEADFKGDLSVKKGDYVYVARDDDAEANKRLVSNEWIFVRKLTLNDRICEGFVPRNHVIRL